MGARTDLLELSQDAVHIWLAFDEELPSEQLLARYRELLTPEERARGLRFYFERDRRQYVVTRALVRTVLSVYAGVDPADWRFSATRHGKPEVSAPDVAVPAFNLSHTKGLVACAVGRTPQLGVDVEQIHRERDLTHLATRYFAPDEVRDLRALPPELQQERFFAYWTLKESYIKARALGLAIPLESFSFGLPCAPSDVVTFRPESGDVTTRWQFQLLRPSPRHLLAVCAQLDWSTPLRVSVRQVVPLSQEWSRECELLRATCRPTCSQRTGLRRTHVGGMANKT